MAKKRSEPGSVIEAQTRVRGRVCGEESLLLRGTVEGDCVLTGNLEIDAGGALFGDAELDDAIIAGRLAGDLVARGRVVLRKTAEVEGNIRAARFAMELGARFEGELTLEPKPAARPGRPNVPRLDLGRLTRSLGLSEAEPREVRPASGKIRAVIRSARAPLADQETQERDEDEASEGRANHDAEAPALEPTRTERPQIALEKKKLVLRVRKGREAKEA